MNMQIYETWIKNRLNGCDCIYYKKIEDKLLAPFKIFYTVNIVYT